MRSSSGWNGPSTTMWATAFGCSSTSRNARPPTRRFLAIRGDPPRRGRVTEGDPSSQGGLGGSREGRSSGPSPRPRPSARALEHHRRSTPSTTLAMPRSGSLRIVWGSACTPTWHRSKEVGSSWRSASTATSAPSWAAFACLPSARGRHRPTRPLRLMILATRSLLRVRPPGAGPGGPGASRRRLGTRRRWPGRRVPARR